MKLLWGGGNQCASGVRRSKQRREPTKQQAERLEHLAVLTPGGTGQQIRRAPPEGARSTPQCQQFRVCLWRKTHVWGSEPMESNLRPTASAQRQGESTSHIPVGRICLRAVSLCSPHCTEEPEKTEQRGTIAEISAMG